MSVSPIGLMPLDGVVVHHLADELNTRLCGGRIDRINQPQRDAVVLIVRQRGESHRLWLDANPNQPSAMLLAKTPTNPVHPPAFCMRLRKALSGGIVVGVSAPLYERVLQIEISQINEMGDNTSMTLIAELMGRHSNLVLINHERRIIDAVRHIDGRVNRVRETLPAHPYVDPPVQNKLSIPDMREALRQGFDPISEASQNSIAATLVGQTQGISPFLAAEVEAMTDLTGRSPKSLSLQEREAVRSAFLALLDRLLDAPPEPTVYRDENHMPYAFHTLRLKAHRGATAAGSVSEAIAAVWAQDVLRQDFALRRAALKKAITAAQERNERKMAIHLDDIEQGRTADTAQTYGHLILAHIHEIKPKATHLSTATFSGDEIVTIPLDPTRSPSANAERYFTRYKKAKTKLKMALTWLNETRREGEYLASLQAMLATAEDDDDLSAIADELDGRKSRAHEHASDVPSGGPGKPKSKKRRAIQAKTTTHRTAAKARDQARPYRRFMSSHGHVIVVGRNNVQNDRLTLRDASKTDLWFHVHNAPGAHVVLKTTIDQAHDDEVLEAAGLAAWYAGQGSSGVALDVDYCPVSHVKKGSGQKAGQVIYNGYRQVRVTPRSPQTLKAPDET